MTKAQDENPRKILDDTATSIKELALDLENKQMEGWPITATDIQTIARQLQTHVEELLAASKSLRDEKSEK